MIGYQAENHLFTLHTRSSSYQFMVDPSGYLLHTYYGPRVGGGSFAYAAFDNGIGVSGLAFRGTCGIGVFAFGWGCYENVHFIPILALCPDMNPCMGHHISPEHANSITDHMLSSSMRSASLCGNAATVKPGISPLCGETIWPKPNVG